MFILAGPYPDVQTTTILPSPDFGNVQEPVATVKSLRAMDGTLYTYTKSKDQRKKCHWDFKLSRDKALEIKAFLSCYYLTKIKVIDHNAVTWIGYLQNNPIELTGEAHAPNFPGGEVMFVSVDFEESE